MSELSRSVKTIRAGIAGIAATSMLLAGCSSKHHGESSPTTPTTTAAPNPNLPTDTTVPNAYTYFMSPERNQRLKAAVQSFGTKVLAASETRDSSWAPFDTFCAPDNGTGVGPEGWVSQGFLPKAGDGCYIQHNPQYGGSSNQISTDGVIGIDGYTDQFLQAGVNTPDCRAVTIGYSSGDKLWDVTYQEGSATILDTQTASTLAQAEAIDNFALSCLSKAI